MNGLPESHRAQDPTLRALVERGLAQARARQAVAATVEPPPGRLALDATRPSSPPRSLGLTSDRACVETNLARKGLWRSASAPGAGGRELVCLLDATDQLGPVQRIDTGPPLGALAFDAIVWVCSRWRERGEVEERHVPFTLEAMADDLGWRKGGGAATDLARALDTLRLATFRARVYNARLGETRIDAFGLIDRWERGERHQSGRPAQPGFVVLGAWLHEQLVRGHVTSVSWAEMRALRSGTARHLLVYLDAERFAGRTWSRLVDDPLLTTLGIVAAKPHHQRATLRRAAAEITSSSNRCLSVALEPGGTGSGPSGPRRRRRASPGSGAVRAMDRGSRRDEGGDFRALRASPQSRR
jgi:hypothetical protein